MPVPNPTMPVKGAGTTLWVYKGSGDPYANPLSDVDWSRLAKVKDLTPGELTAASTTLTFYKSGTFRYEDVLWPEAASDETKKRTAFAGTAISIV